MASRIKPIESQPAEATKRARLTDDEKDAMFARQKGMCCCGCGRQLNRKTMEGEHSHQIALGGAASPKPDRLIRPDCHKIKSALDAKIRARAKRRKLYHDTGKSHAKMRVKKIPSRPFQRKIKK